MQEDEVSKSWAQRRRRFRAEARRIYPERQTAWIGGVLFFTDLFEKVPEVQSIPRPGRKAIGLAAIGKNV